jgi:4-amino-4-deoxy-L-arabinose transferase-like glycosyltransferase
VTTLPLRPGFWLAGAAVFALVGLGFDLGGYPLLDPDEGRNAEVAREMATANDYLLPRLNGLPYPDKPVLYFAVVAAAIEIFGPSAAAARLPSLLFTLATLGLVAWLGARWFGRDAGIAAAIATGATPFTIAYARTVIFDAALTLFITLALVGFYEAMERVGSADRRTGGSTGPRPTAEPSNRRTAGAVAGPGWWTALAWASMACGVLTKGPVALALPLLVALPYAAWRRAWRALADPVAVLLFLALLGPWLLATSRVVPEFLEHALATETALRLTTDRLGRSEPFWYFLVIFPAAAVPWTPLLAAAGWRLRRAAHRPADSRIVFLLLWILVPLALFTLSQSKRPQYVLPLVPAVGLLVGALWRARPGALPGTRAAAGCLGALGAVLLGGQGLIPGLVSATPHIAATIPETAGWLGAACLVSGVAAWATRARRRVALAALTLPAAAIPITSRELMDAVGRERSARDLAAAIAPVIDPTTEIVGVRAFPLSLPFYLERTLTLASEDASELTSNYLQRRPERWRNAPGSPLRPADWWVDALARCGRPRVFVVRAGDERARAVLSGALPLLIETSRYAAYGPCGVTGLATAGAEGAGEAEGAGRPLPLLPLLPRGRAAG